MHWCWRTTAIAAALGFAVSAPDARGAAVPLLRYTFDDGAATDSVAPAANGTLVPGSTGAGFVTNTPSGTGQAYSTGTGSDGTVDAGYITAGDIAKTEGLTAVTVTAWLNLRAEPFNDTVVERIVSDGGVNVPGFDFSIIGPSADDVDLQAFVRGSTASNGRSSVGFDASNKWVFVAFTYDGAVSTANGRFYVGSTSSPVAQLGTSFNFAAGPMAGGNAFAFEVAGTGESGADRTPTAFLDDVRVFDGVADLAFLEGVRAENVPEPTALGVVAAGAVLGLLRRRRRRS